MGFWNLVTGSTPAGVISETGAKVVSGVFEGVKGLIEEFHLSPEDAQKFELRLAELQLQTYQTQITDVQSARSMQVANKSVWPGLLSAITLIGFFGAGAYIIKYGLPQTSAEGRDIILIMVQTLVMGVGLVYGFWLGTTNNSANKDAMLWRSRPLGSDDPKPPTT